MRLARRKERFMKVYPASSFDTLNGCHCFSCFKRDFDFFMIGFMSSTCMLHLSSVIVLLPLLLYSYFSKMKEAALVSVHSDVL